MREIVLDTETTGLDALNGDRIVEIGCIELLNHIPTGRHWHSYLNPDRDMPAAAYDVHGLSSEFLKDKPRFNERAEELLAFIDDAQVVIHNAGFDLNFLNIELQRCGKTALDPNRVVDTLALARRKHPGAPNSLDALCRRYQIDRSKRTKHGALLDSELLATVYIELLGKRQAHLELAAITLAPGLAAQDGGRIYLRPKPLAPRLSEDEATAHAAFVTSLGPKALWAKYPRD